MARITTIEVHCPNCGKKVPTMARGPRVYIGSKAYGVSLRRCRRCGRLYKQFEMEEAALTLTEKSRVRWYLSSQRFLVAIIIVAVFYIVFVYTASDDVARAVVATLQSAIAVLGCLGGLGLLTWPLRQWNMKRVLRRSREMLLQNDEYLLCFLGYQPAALKGPDGETVRERLTVIRGKLQECFQKDELPVIRRK